MELYIIALLGVLLHYGTKLTKVIDKLKSDFKFWFWFKMNIAKILLAIASAVTLVFMFFQHMTDPKLIEILAEKLSMLEIVEYWKITLYIMVLAAGWWSSSFIRDIVDTGKIIFTWLITKIKSMFAKLFGIKIEIDD